MNQKISLFLFLLMSLFFSGTAIALEGLSNHAVTVNFKSGNIVKGDLLGLEKETLTLVGADGKGQEFDLKQVKNILDAEGKSIYETDKGTTSLKTETPVADKKLAVEKQKPQPANEDAAPEQLRPHGLYVGVGWPDAKVRYDFKAPFSLEGKYAFGDGISVASGRLYYRWLKLGAIEITSGVEGGYINFAAGAGDDLAVGMTSSPTMVKTPAGNGWEAEGFVGAELNAFSDRVKVAIDFGPAYLSLGSGGANVTAVEWIVTTGFYVRLF